MVYKIAKDSNVDQLVPNVFTPLDGLLKGLVESQADIIRAHNKGRNIQVWEELSVATKCRLRRAGSFAQTSGPLPSPCRVL